MQGQGTAGKRRLPEGVRERHRRSCKRKTLGECTCTPRYEAHVYIARDGRKVTKAFPTIAAAKAWRADALHAVRKGTMRAPTPLTLREAAEEWLTGARAGGVRPRGGGPYKPSAVRSYESSLRLHVLPRLGNRKLSQLTRNDLQDVIEEMHAAGYHASTIRNAMMPVRAILRRSITRGQINVNPAAYLESPRVESRRDRIAPPAEAQALLDALPAGERALWATAFFAGLRHGELKGLGWETVDLANGVIRVQTGWDQYDGPIPPKSKAGIRTVPIPPMLRDYLTEHRMITERAEGLVFGRSEERPFSSSTANDRAYKAWKAAGLTRITLHEARHTFASLMIAAGVNIKALSTYMGHTSITITLDRYGHLLPGNEAEAAALLDAFWSEALATAREMRS